MASMNDTIRAALMEIGADELYNRIEEIRTPQYDALVWFDPETKRIDVEPLLSGYDPPSDDDRILLHWGKVNQVEEYEVNDLFNNHELECIKVDFNNSILDFLSSQENKGGTLGQRAAENRRFYWKINWNSIIDEWIKRIQCS